MVLFLVEEERRLLLVLKKEEDDILGRLQDSKTSLDHQSRSLDRLLLQLEEQSQQEPLQMLQVRPEDAEGPWDYPHAATNLWVHHEVGHGLRLCHEVRHGLRLYAQPSSLQNTCRLTGWDGLRVTSPSHPSAEQQTSHIAHQ